MSEEDDDSRLEGTISEGDLESDFSGEEEVKEEKGEETSMDEEEKDPIVGTPEEETSDAPVEEETPVAEEPKEEPEEAVTEEPKEEEAPAVEAAPAAEPSVIPLQKKKSKKGLIIFLIIFAILLIGGGVGFAIWMSIHESPEVALKDALAGFWTSENIQLSGDVTMEASGADVTYSIDAIKSGKNISGGGAIKAEYAGQDIKLDFSAAYVDSGTVYMKFDGLKKLAEELDFGSMLGGLLDADESGIDFSSLISSVIGSVAEKVDGNWYKITTGDAKDLNNSRQLSCVLENLGDALSQDSMGKIADVYKDNAFLEIDKDASVSDKDGAKVYTIKINKDIQKKFGEAAKNVDALKKLEKCSESEVNYDVEEDEEYVTLDGDDDEDDYGVPKRVERKEDPEVDLKLRITPWTHKLVGIEITQKTKGESDSKVSADLKVSYDKKDVEEPSDAKSIKTLESDLKEAVSNAMTKLISQLCTSIYGEYGDEYVNACVEAASESNEGFDFSTIFQQLFGGSTTTTEPDCLDGDEVDC